MLNANYTTVERIIAKIDNDFNPNNSDWIPRVAAWCIDAMQQLDVLLTEKVRKKLTVKGGIAMSDCCLKGLDIKVFDKNGCEIPKAGTRGSCGCNNPSTGETQKDNSDASCHHMRTHRTVEFECYPNAKETIAAQAQQINGAIPARYNVKEVYRQPINNQNYVISGDFTIELNFDTDYIFIEYNTIKTVEGHDGNQYPMIPNNGKLIEAIAYYCVYKMLCRGYQHPVFNLQASQYGTNPYYIWTTSKEEAKRSVINDGVNQDASKLFRSAFFISSFDSRRRGY